MKVTMESAENNCKNEVEAKKISQKLCKHRETMYFRRI